MAPDHDRAKHGARRRIQHAHVARGGQHRGGTWTGAWPPREPVGAGIAGEHTSGSLIERNQVTQRPLRVKEVGGRQGYT